MSRKLACLTREGKPKEICYDVSNIGQISPQMLKTSTVEINIFSFVGKTESVLFCLYEFDIAFNYVILILFPCSINFFFSALNVYAR